MAHRFGFTLALIFSPVAAALAGGPPLDTNDPPGRAPFTSLRIPASPQRPGAAKLGYQYLVAGDYVRGGVPMKYMWPAFAAALDNPLGRRGDNALLPIDLTASTAHNGVRVAAPNCLACHAQSLRGTLIVGLGNSTIDLTVDGNAVASAIEQMIDRADGPRSPEAEAYRQFRRVTRVIGPQIRTRTVGLNSADKLAFVLTAHRDPQTLAWSDHPLVPLPAPTQVIPTDVPAWWLLKKKHAMFYTGIGRGDFARIMMASSLLTLTDTGEAAEIDRRFADVLAWLNTIEPPAYPGAIDVKLARRGRGVFKRQCADCHGTYDDPDTYPNLLIGLDEIGTDPELARASAVTYARQVQRYNVSWFAAEPHAARLVPRLGYVAPPLDGVWATAPYLHNGSVPTLAALLDSSQRPRFWRRSFDTNDYDLEAVGWQYHAEPRGGSKYIYDTTLPGCSNAGHTYGDDLTPDERLAVIEYLKAL